MIESTDVIGKTLYTRGKYEARVLGILKDAYGKAEFFGAYRAHETDDWHATQWKLSGKWHNSLESIQHYLDLMLPRRRVWIFWDKFKPRASGPAVFFVEEVAREFSEKNRDMVMQVIEEPECSSYSNSNGVTGFTPAESSRETQPIESTGSARHVADGLHL